MQRGNSSRCSSLARSLQGSLCLTVDGSVFPLHLWQHRFSRFLCREHLYATLILSRASATTGVLFLDELLFLSDCTSSAWRASVTAAAPFSRALR